MAARDTIGNSIPRHLGFDHGRRDIAAAPENLRRLTFQGAILFIHPIANADAHEACQFGQIDDPVGRAYVRVAAQAADDHIAKDRLMVGVRDVRRLVRAVGRQDPQLRIAAGLDGLGQAVGKFIDDHAQRRVGRKVPGVENHDLQARLAVRHDL